MKSIIVFYIYSITCLVLCNLIKGTTNQDVYTKYQYQLYLIGTIYVEVVEFQKCEKMGGPGIIV